ncbi:hypothetical protein GCM10027440_00160 [Nocardiopsis coralliicola]
MNAPAVGSVGGDTGDIVTSAQAPVNTGGRQDNRTFNVGPWAPPDAESLLALLRSEDRSAADAGGSITTADIERNDACFVKPPGFSRILSGDEAPAALLISGPRGSGRRGAAMRWLSEFGAPEKGIRTLPDADRPPLLDGEAISEGELLYLDATLSDGTRATALLRELPRFAAEVAERGGRIAVVLEPQQAIDLEVRAEADAVAVRRPDTGAVLRSYLGYLRITAGPREFAAAGITDWLAAAGVEETVQLAYHARDASLAEEGTGTVADWLATAHRAAGDWREDVAGWLDSQPAPQDRAVLLAAAVFENATAEQVAAAAEGLAEATAVPEEEGSPLERLGFAGRLKRLGAVIREDRRVEFERFGYGEAVLTRFWDEYPWLHEVFEKWISRILEKERIHLRDRLRAAERFAEQCLRVRRHGPLLTLARRWSNGPLWTAELALELLRCGLRDERAAPAVRRWLYDTAKEESLPASCIRVVTAVSYGVLADTHPNQAIVRLHHAARRGGAGPEPRQAAGEAALRLADLARESSSLRSGVLRRFADRFAAGPGKYWDADASILWGVVDPAVLTSSGGFPLTAAEGGDLRTCLAAVWRRDRAEVRPHARRWLEFWTGGPHRTTTVSLITGAAADAGRLDALYAETRTWLAETADGDARGSRQVIARQVRSEIDAWRRPAEPCRTARHRSEEGRWVSGH